MNEYELNLGDESIPEKELLKKNQIKFNKDDIDKKKLFKIDILSFPKSVASSIILNETLRALS